MPATPNNVSAQWELSDGPQGAVVVRLSGELDTVSTPQAWREMEAALKGRRVTALKIDARGLDSCDSAGLALLYHLSNGGLTSGVGGEVEGLHPQLQHLFRSFSMEDFRALEEHEPACSNVVEDIGVATEAWLIDLRQQVEFIGEVTFDIAASLLRPRRMRWREVLRLFEIAGVNALPIVSLLTFLVGMVIAFESAQPLA